MPARCYGSPPDLEKSPCSVIGRVVLLSCRSGPVPGKKSSARPGCQGVSEEGKSPLRHRGEPPSSRTFPHTIRPPGHRIVSEEWVPSSSPWAVEGYTPGPDPVTPAFLRIRRRVTDQRGQKRAVPQVPVHGVYRFMFRPPMGIINHVQLTLFGIIPAEITGKNLKH